MFSTKALTPLRLVTGILASLILLGGLLAANWVTTDYGFIPVGFGLMATAGTFFAGLTLAMRDLVQDTLGRIYVVGLILIGTVISFAIAAPAIAIASAAAFLISEMLDFAIYTPLRAKAKVGDKRWAVAVLASNTVGAVVDTVVFLGIAFGMASILPALPGQLVGKTYATIGYLILGAMLGVLLRHLARKRADSRVAEAAEEFTRVP